MWDLKQKTILVTGGSKGIGKAIVQEALTLGARVLTISRGCVDFQDPNLTHLKGDICDEEFQKCVAEFVRKKQPCIHGLVHNIGMNIRKKWSDYSSEEIAKVLQTNLLSAYSLSQQLDPFLPQNGSIVFISSVAGHTHLKTGAPYAMSKAAMNQLVKNLAVELAPREIRVNAISPWYTDTPLAQTVLAQKAYMESVLERTPYNRIAKPEEVARPCCFLLMDAASFITGQSLAVDGGFLANGFS